MTVENAFAITQLVLSILLPPSFSASSIVLPTFSLNCTIHNSEASLQACNLLACYDPST